MHEPRFPLPLPAYYREHIAEKNEKVNRLLALHPEASAFVFFTDLHISDNALMSPGIIASILENTPVRDVLCGGDVINSYGAEKDALDWCRLYHDCFDFAAPYFVRGNHDIYIKESETVRDGYFAPEQLVYELFFRDHPQDIVSDGESTYYYVDRPERKLRYLIVDTNEDMQYCPVGDGYFEVSVRLTQKQLDKLAAWLKGTPKGYTVVMAGHRPIDRRLPWYAENVTILNDLIEAYNGRKKIDYTDAYGLHLQADFEGCGGHILLYISGHGHTDARTVSESGCIHYEVNDDALIDNGGSRFPRLRGTLSENAVDVVILDPEARKMYTVRYGAGEDITD